jgi:hypothetical protein
MTAAKKKGPARVLRWITVTEDNVQWGQIKSVAHPSEDRDIQLPTDRHINFVRQEPNPDYVPQDERKEGKKYSTTQMTPTNSIFKYPKKTRDGVVALGKSAMKQLSKLVGHKVVQATYSLEAESLSYVQEFLFDGEPYQERKTTDDETMIEIFQQLADEVLKSISTKTKPIGLASPESAEKIES